MLKKGQGNRYSYKVVYAYDGWPAGSMYMKPYQIRQFLCYVDLSSLDWQLKRKNVYGWVCCGAEGTKNNKKLVHFAHSLMIAEFLGFAEFLLRTMSEISGQSMDNIKVIAM